MSRTDRERQGEALDDLDMLPDDQQAGSCGVLLVTFTEGTYPTAAGLVYACHPVFVDAANTEGATPTFSTDTTVKIYAANVGSEIPPSGSYVIGTCAGGRVTFSWNNPP